MHWFFGLATPQNNIKCGKLNLDLVTCVLYFQNKYVKLSDVIALFPKSMTTRVMNLVETLSSISSLKQMHTDSETKTRYLHIGSLLAFILVYPYCPPFERTRDEILR